MATRTPDEIVAAIVGFVNHELMAAGHAIAATDGFELAGIDSMALLKILLFVEREFGFWMPDEDLVVENVASAAALGHYVALQLRSG